MSTLVSGSQAVSSAFKALTASNNPPRPSPPVDLGDADTLFQSLLEFTWRGVSFPVYTMRVRLRQDLVQHLYPDSDGGHIEATGRAPLEFSATIPFLNGITPGPQEHWQQGRLFPEAYRTFFSACGDRSDGQLQHPVFGLVTAKISECESVWEADKRDGAIVVASWLESTNDPNASNDIIDGIYPVPLAVGASLDLDTQLSQISPPIPNDAVATGPQSFAQAMTAIQAVSDQLSLFQLSVTGQIDQFTYRTAQLTASLDKLGNVQNWPVRQSIERMKAASIAMKGNLATLGASKAIGLYTMPTDGTVGLVCTLTKSKPKDILTLNPNFAFCAIVPANTVVRYYTSAA